MDQKLCSVVMMELSLEPRRRDIIDYMLQVPFLDVYNME